MPDSIKTSKSHVTLKYFFTREKSGKIVLVDMKNNRQSELEREIIEFVQKILKGGDSQLTPIQFTQRLFTRVSSLLGNSIPEKLKKDLEALIENHKQSVERFVTIPLCKDLSDSERALAEKAIGDELLHRASVLVSKIANHIEPSTAAKSSSSAVSASSSEAGTSSAQAVSSSQESLEVRHFLNHKPAEIIRYKIDENGDVTFLISSDRDKNKTFRQLEKNEKQGDHVTAYVTFLSAVIHSIPRVTRFRDLRKIIFDRLAFTFNDKKVGKSSISDRQSFIAKATAIINNLRGDTPASNDNSPSSPQEDESNFDRIRRTITTKLKRNGFSQEAVDEMDRALKSNQQRTVCEEICAISNLFVNTINAEKFGSLGTDKSVENNESKAAYALEDLRTYYQLLKANKEVVLKISANGDKPDLKHPAVKRVIENNESAVSKKTVIGQFKKLQTQTPSSIATRLEDYFYTLLDLDYDKLKTELIELKTELEEDRKIYGESIIDDTLAIISKNLIRRHVRCMGILCCDIISGIIPETEGERRGEMLKALVDGFLERICTPRSKSSTSLERIFNIAEVEEKEEGEEVEEVEEVEGEKGEGVKAKEERNRFAGELVLILQQAVEMSDSQRLFSGNATLSAVAARATPPATPARKTNRGPRLVSAGGSAVAAVGDSAAAAPISVQKVRISEGQGLFLENAALSAVVARATTPAQKASRKPRVATAAASSSAESHSGSSDKDVDLAIDLRLQSESSVTIGNVAILSSTLQQNHKLLGEELKKQIGLGIRHILIPLHVHKKHFITLQVLIDNENVTLNYIDPRGEFIEQDRQALGKVRAALTFACGKSTKFEAYQTCTTLTLQEANTSNCGQTEANTSNCSQTTASVIRALATERLTVVKNGTKNHLFLDQEPLRDFDIESIERVTESMDSSISTSPAASSAVAREPRSGNYLNQKISSSLREGPVRIGESIVIPTCLLQDPAQLGSALENARDESASQILIPIKIDQNHFGLVQIIREDGADIVVNFIDPSGEKTPTDNIDSILKITSEVEKVFKTSGRGITSNSVSTNLRTLLSEDKDYANTTADLILAMAHKKVVKSGVNLISAADGVTIGRRSLSEVAASIRREGNFSRSKTRPNTPSDSPSRLRTRTPPSTPMSAELRIESATGTPNSTSSSVLQTEASPLSPLKPRQLF